MDFYHPKQIQLPNNKSYPIFLFEQKLKEINPTCQWTIIGKPPAMADYHVAEIYGKSTKALNQQIQRNQEYFKPEWRF